MKCSVGCSAVGWGFDLILLGLHDCPEEALMIKMLFSSLPRVYVMHTILPLNLTLVACWSPVTLQYWIATFPFPQEILGKDAQLVVKECKGLLSTVLGAAPT